jgi:hypothetical protein
VRGEPVPHSVNLKVLRAEPQHAQAVRS